VFCLKVDIDGVVTDITPQTFKHHAFANAKVISGEKYYIDKAVSLGAIKAKAKKKD
jgi:hypothetical protein